MKFCFFLSQKAFHKQIVYNCGNMFLILCLLKIVRLIMNWFKSSDNQINTQVAGAALGGVRSSKQATSNGHRPDEMRRVGESTTPQTTPMRLSLSPPLGAFSLSPSTGVPSFSSYSSYRHTLDDDDHFTASLTSSLSSQSIYSPQPPLVRLRDLVEDESDEHDNSRKLLKETSLWFMKICIVCNFYSKDFSLLLNATQIKLTTLLIG